MMRVVLAAARNVTPSICSLKFGALARFLRVLPIFVAGARAADTISG